MLSGGDEHFTSPCLICDPHFFSASRTYSMVLRLLKKRQLSSSATYMTPC